MASFHKTTLETVEFKTPRLKQAVLVIDDWTLAFRLGFTGKTLWAVINRHNDFLKQKDGRGSMYSRFPIKKANGKLRWIHAPERMMKIFLTQMRTRILLPLTATLGPHVAAYQVGKSTRDSARFHLQPCEHCAPLDQPHTCKEAVLEHMDGGYRVFREGQRTCVACQPVPHHDCSRRGVKIHFDLKDFFGSTRRAWARKYFHEVVGYNHYVSSLLADAMTVAFPTKDKKVRHGVPQGAPTSGDLCNLIADWRLDQPLLKALAGTGWVYSRYADDLYLSHSKNLSRDAVDQVIQQVNTLIEAAGYRMNRQKLHIQRPSRRQQLLGIVLNQKLNIPNDQYKRMKAVVTNCLHNGFEAEAKKKEFETTGKFVAWIGGKLTYFSTLNPRKAERLKAILELAKQRHALDITPTFTLRKAA